jgi:hypothetical protein
MNHVWIGALAAIPFVPITFLGGMVGAEWIADRTAERAARKRLKALGIDPDNLLDEIMRMYRR